jgi:hypothetical protein
MMNWFDLMRQAQGGAGLDNLSRQFGLSAQQTHAALAALMPAFAMGLQHAAADPNAMGRLFQSMMSGHYPTFWESAAQAFTPQAKQEGARLLDQLFGSDEVSRRVARQAASFSGVGVDVLQQMLPLIAGIVAGGLAKVATAQGAALQETMQNLQSSAPPQPAPQAQPSGPTEAQNAAAAWTDLWRQWLALAAPPAPPDPGPPKPPAPPAPTTHPFEDVMASFLKPPPGAAPEPETAPEPRPEPASGASPEADPFQAWGDFIEKGHEMQRQHLASLQSIFEGVWGPGGKR